jgi:hypothetical protein
MGVILLGRGGLPAAGRRAYTSPRAEATCRPVTGSGARKGNGEAVMRGFLGLILSLLAMLAGAAGFAWYVWRDLGDVEISFHGYVALAAGVTAALGLGVGLMWLVYYSHRRGFDDEVGRD